MNKEDLQKTIVNEILMKGLKKKFVAEKIGINPVTLSYYLNGHKTLSEKTIKKLREFLNV